MNNRNKTDNILKSKIVIKEILEGIFYAVISRLFMTVYKG